MVVKIVCIGPLTGKSYPLLQNDLITRISGFTRIEVIELPRGKAKIKDERLKQEAVKLERYLLPNCYQVLLDERGEPMTSTEMAGFFEKLQIGSTKGVNFIVGSAFGIADIFKAKVKHKLQLSAFTITHELSRILLLEQIYRSFTIINGHPFHH